MSTQQIVINGRPIGPGHRPYIVAELSANHNGSLDRALDTIVMAKQAGADAVKIQTYTADTLTIDCNSEEFQIHGGLWDGYNLYQLYQQAYTPWEWHAALFEKAREVGITLFSTPFDHTSVDLLEALDSPVYKIASFEAIDLPLIRRVAQTGKPMIISTGMADLGEISEAVEMARANGCEQLVLLHCISCYPTPPEQSNLATIADLAKRFDVLAGLSDHTLGTTVAVTSVALGACLIEKHVTLDRGNEGPDSAFSLEPPELEQLCHDAETAWKALGVAGYERKPAEQGNLKFRRSLYVVEDIAQGDLFTTKNIRSIRPGFGLAPKHYDGVLGRRASKNITRGTALDWPLVE